MASNSVKRRELLKKAGVGVSALSVVSGLGTDVSSASDKTTDISVEGKGSSTSNYTLKIAHAAGAVTALGSNDSISSNDGDAVINGTVSADGTDNYTVDQTQMPSPSETFSIRYASSDNGIYLIQQKGTPNPYERFSYRLTGDGEYRITTNYGDCLCGDAQSCEYTTNCQDIIAADWNSGEDSFGRYYHSSYIDGAVTPDDKDDYVMSGDVSTINLSGGVTMQPW